MSAYLLCNEQFVSLAGIPKLYFISYPIKFSFQDCNFKMQKGKEGTGRVVMWKMGVNNSYTLEVTFCGSKLGKGSNITPELIINVFNSSSCIGEIIAK